MDAIKLQQRAYRLYKRGFKRVANLICSYIYFRCNSDMSPLTEIGENTKLGHRGIGNVIHPKSKIGRYCLIAQNCTLAGEKGEAPCLGDYVYVGSNSVILGGVKIADNVTVGALTLVNKDIPDNAIVVGSPGRVLRIKTPEEVEAWKKMVEKNNRK